MATASKKAAPKKAAAKKAAAPKKASAPAAAPKKAQAPAKETAPEKKAKPYEPENGEIVEFDVTRRGTYRDGKVKLAGGEEVTPTGPVRKAITDGLGAADAQNIQHNINKERTWDEIGVPAQHRGENINEQNPFLAGAITREKITDTAKQIGAQPEETTVRGAEAEEALSQQAQEQA